MSVTMMDRMNADISDRADAVIDLSERIHAEPELAWEEEKASLAVAEFMSASGFTVEHGGYGLPTAVRASVGSGPLTVIVCAEYDALPGLGHACGHNLITAVAVATACALATVADDLGIRVVLLGTPAEEGGGGKIMMLDRGAFADGHLAVMAHPGPLDVAHARSYAVNHLRIAYEGKGAHAAAYPERGVNAADAFTVAQVAIGLLRQQLAPDVRVHGLVTKAGDAANAIAEHTEGRWYVRAETTADMLQATGRVTQCFTAGAVATGCELRIEPEGPPYAEFRNNEWILQRYIAHATHLGRRFATDDEPGAAMNRASTDMGNVSQQMPAIHPYFGIGSLPAVNHQREFADAAVTPQAHVAMLQAATGLAAAVADAAVDERQRDRLLTRAGMNDA